MEPVNFKEANTQIAKEQPEYMTLPAFVEPGGEVTSVWKLTEEELKKIVEKGYICLCVHTHNNPLPPVRLWVPDGNDVNEIPHE
jgi:hypothetical protein